MLGWVMRFVEVIAQVYPAASAQVVEGGTEVPEIGLLLSLDILVVGGYEEVSRMCTGIRGGGDRGAFARTLDGEGRKWLSIL